MRMHPRKFGAYSMSARIASEIVQEPNKNKKSKQQYNRQNSSNADDSVAVALLVGFVLMVVALAMLFGSCESY